MPPDDGDVIRVLVAEGHPVARSGPGRRPVLARRLRGRRRRHRRPRGRARGGAAPTGRRPHGPAHARHRRVHRHPRAGPGHAVRTRVRAHDVRRRRLALRRRAGRRPRVPAQGCRAGGHRPGGAGHRGRRGDLRPGHRGAGAAPAHLSPTGATPNPFPDLTARELEILELLATATPTAVIARELQVTPKTVSNHVSTILTKLRAADRTQAAMLARDAGLGRAAAQDPGRRDDRPSGRDGRGP